ncbi:cytochrome c oxidase subunit II [Legionella micdadei]|uniref:Cytochrome c oxidase subunit 2 n=1 Tax=Legionella micdadei TaxID=451 RepID=A0A098GBX1_LEGMI|nr:cytochrome c oxidase subunit II [Legionella micdadei]ARG99036.1 cytochrome c oxidase subunit II [Legionella micdadei]KTD29101.1 cytochrome c oxidase subunit II [Legionella micdadei]NSL17310.1 cytochrome c oxidase subunit II [Legionella micdadei]CEG59467.1 Cytochrome c oxidase subunit 2 [Legionella micdadei]
MQNRSKVSKGLTALIGLVVGQQAMAEADKWQLNMYKGVTPISHDVYDLHMIAMVICAIIGIVVFGVMIYSLIHHRKSKGHTPATFHDNFRLEIVWSIIPFLILLGLAVPATKVLIRQDDSSDSDVTIKVVGYQWKWQYQYLDQGISFFSNLSTPFSQINNQQAKGEWYLLEVDKPLVVPVNKKIRFLVTSNDVVHSWWVPELGVKRDAIPGFMHEAWARIEKPGTYRGQCAELCGINHGFMPIVVQAVNEEEFNQWVASQVKVKDQYAEEVNQPTTQASVPRDELMSLGKQMYDQNCAACHQADGKGLPPMYPALKGSSVAVGKPISRHISLVLNGIPGSAMQPYRDQLSDKDIAAIITYERNAWENNTGDVVQPADVAKVRQDEMKQPKMVEKAKVGGLR